MNLSHSERSIPVERDVTYHVRVGGQGSPLLLLHGFTGSSASWNGIADALAASHTLLQPDLLGHGQTSAPDNPDRYAMRYAAADLFTIFDMHGIERAGVHGYSMGGRLALYIALEYPQRITRLSLESASPGLPTDEERASRRDSDNALAKRILKYGVDAFVDEWEKQPLFATQARVPDEIRERQHRQRLANSAIGLAGSLRGMGTGVQPELWPRLGELQMPVLLITGALDAKFSQFAEEMATHIPNATHVTVPDCGHTVYLEQPDAWLSIVGEFHR